MIGYSIRLGTIQKIKKAKNNTKTSAASPLSRGLAKQGSVGKDSNLTAAANSLGITFSLASIPDTVNDKILSVIVRPESLFVTKFLFQIHLLLKHLCTWLSMEWTFFLDALVIQAGSRIMDLAGQGTVLKSLI